MPLAASLQRVLRITTTTYYFLKTRKLKYLSKTRREFIFMNAAYISMQVNKNKLNNAVLRQYFSFSI